MLQSKKNELTQSILKRLKKPAPSIEPIDIMPEMDQSDGEVPVDEELDMMGQQVQAAPSNGLLSKLRKRKQKLPDPDPEY